MVRPWRPYGVTRFFDMCDKRVGRASFINYTVELAPTAVDIQLFNLLCTDQPMELATNNQKPSEIAKQFKLK